MFFLKKQKKTPTGVQFFDFRGRFEGDFSGYGDMLGTFFSGQKFMKTTFFCEKSSVFGLIFHFCKLRITLSVE